MKECPVCGHQLADDSPACPICGCPVEEEMPPIPEEQTTDTPPIPSEEPATPTDMPPVPEASAEMPPIPEEPTVVPPPPPIPPPIRDYEPKEERPSGSRSGLWIALVIIALVLTGGGIGLYFYLSDDKTVRIEENEDEEEIVDDTDWERDTIVSTTPYPEDYDSTEAVAVEVPDMDESLEGSEEGGISSDDLQDNRSEPTPPTVSYSSTGRVYGEDVSTSVNLSFSVRAGIVSGTSSWSGGTEALSGSMSSDGHLIIHESGGSRYDGYLQGNTYKGTYYDNSGTIGTFNFYVE